MATTRELLNIQSLLSIKLLAGEEGLDRRVTWPYVVLSWPISSWVSGGEILIYYGVNMYYDNISLMEMVQAASENNSAGIILLTGDRYIIEPKLSAELLALADELSMPLFSLPSTAVINSITKDIINLIQYQDKKVAAASDFWYSVFFETKEEELTEILHNKALFLGYNPKESYRVYIINFTNLENYLKTENLHNSPNNPEELLRMINDKIIYHLNHMISPGYWYCLHRAYVIFVMPVSRRSEQKIDEAFLKIFEVLATQYPNARLQAGKGRIASTLLDIKESFLEAARSVSLGGLTDIADRKIIDYEALGIYRIFFSLNNENILKQYVEYYLSPLHIYDKDNDTDLYETLKAYLDCNCNQAQAAKKLYIHRNTIPPRLEKMEAVLNISFTDNNDIYNLRTALFAERFMTNSL